MVDSVQPVIMRIANRAIAVSEELEIPCSGTNFFRLRSATADLHVRFNGGTAIKFSSGQSYNSPVALEKITLSNQSGAINTVDVFISDGDVKDDALTVTGPITIGNAVEIIRASSITHSADTVIAGGGFSQFYGGGITVIELVLSNQESNFYPFRIGGWNPANSGFLLAPGETIKLPFTGAISAYNTAPYSQSLSFSRINE